MAAPPKLPPVFKTMMDEHGACLARVVRRGGVPTSEVPDAVAAVFVIAWTHYESFNRSHSHKAWLVRVAGGVCADYRKRARTTREVLVPNPDAAAISDMPGPEEVLLAREARTILNEVIAEDLVPGRSEVLLMHLEEVSAANIAAELGIAEDTVYARIQLASQDLKSALEKRRLRATRRRTRHLLALPLAELLRLDAAAGPELDGEARRRMVEVLFVDDAVQERDDRTRARRSGPGEPGAPAQGPQAFDLPARSWGSNLLARAAPLGRWFASQVPGVMIGATAVLTLAPTPAPVAVAVPLHDGEHVIIATSTAASPTTMAAGAPAARAETPPLTATASTGAQGKPVLDDEAERRILRRAHGETILNNSKAALATLKRLDNAARSESDEERDILVIDGLTRQGRLTEAQRLGRTFKALYPNSIHLPRLDAMLKQAP